MKRSNIFNNPLSALPLTLVARLLHWLNKDWLIKDNFPRQIEKAVIVAAPHSSNWDFVWMLIFAFTHKVELSWMGKDSLFKFPFGWIMRYAGGIPIDRRSSHMVVDQLVKAFKERDRLLLVNTPEGTRTKVKRWKTGFYYIALKAKVPLILATIDYKDKVVSFDGIFWPTGDLEADLPQIQAYSKHCIRKDDL